LEPIDANAVVRDAIEIANSAILSKKLRVSTELDAEKHHIRGDSIRLQQIFWNLINNAVKFTPSGGQIAVRTYNDNAGHFRFEITDNGIGIERERLLRSSLPLNRRILPLAVSSAALG
jgi:Osmosensitive K+ channel histidine kinase